MPRAHGQNAGRGIRQKVPLTAVLWPLTMIGTRQRATAPYRPAANRGGASRFSCQANAAAVRDLLPALLRPPDESVRLGRRGAEVDPDALTESQHRLAELAKHDDPSPPVETETQRPVTVEDARLHTAKSPVARVQWQSVVERNGRSSAVRRGDRRNRERRDADPHDNRDLEKSETASHCSRSIPASCWSRCCHCRGRVPEVVDRSPDLARLVSVHDLQEVAR